MRFHRKFKMTMTFDDSSETVKQIRNELSDLMKKADEFVVLVETRIKGRENELTEQMRKFEILKEKEKKLTEYETELKKRESLINTEKQGLRDKQIVLAKKEEELQSKLERVKNLLA